MHNIDYAELETNFEQYVERAHNGEEFVITRDGKPLVKLVACQPTLPRIGALKGQGTLDAEASGAMDKKIENLFDAGEKSPQVSSTAPPGPIKPADGDKGA